MKKLIQQGIRLINVPHVICDHIFNGKHTKTHRFFVGGIVAFSGLLISKVHVELTAIHYALEYVGYAIHGLGLVPVVEHFAGGKK